MIASAWTRHDGEIVRRHLDAHTSAAIRSTVSKILEGKVPEALIDGPSPGFGTRSLLDVAAEDILGDLEERVINDPIDEVWEEFGEYRAVIRSEEPGEYACWFIEDRSRSGFETRIVLPIDSSGAVAGPIRLTITEDGCEIARRSLSIDTAYEVHGEITGEITGEIDAEFSRLAAKAE